MSDSDEIANSIIVEEGIMWVDKGTFVVFPVIASPEVGSHHAFEFVAEEDGTLRIYGGWQLSTFEDHMEFVRLEGEFDSPIVTIPQELRASMMRFDTWLQKHAEADRLHMIRREIVRREALLPDDDQADTRPSED